MFCHITQFISGFDAIVDEFFSNGEVTSVKFHHKFPYTDFPVAARLNIQNWSKNI